jgi:hypothetical protein
VTHAPADDPWDMESCSTVLLRHGRLHRSITSTYDSRVACGVALAAAVGRRRRRWRTGAPRLATEQKAGRGAGGPRDSEAGISAAGRVDAAVSAAVAPSGVPIT